MKRIGIMTYHAAHNYGSALQAYATQKTLEKLGYESEIINYRLKNQKDFYNKVLITKLGIKSFVKSVLYFYEFKKRKIRNEKFEDFIYNNMTLSEKEYNTFEELKNERFDYDIFMSGSDQVWNIHCGAEFKNEPANSIMGYFLAFAPESVKKISFSSSIGSMNAEEMKNYADYLKQYAHLAVREKQTAEMLTTLLNKQVYNTIDPTLMLNAQEWSLLINNKPEGDYVFVYILDYPYFKFKKFLKNVRDYAKNLGLKVYCVAPYIRTNVKGVKNCIDCGPLDFLAYVKNAKLVITSSYHGTLFSINFGVPFYDYEQNPFDPRKSDFLKKVGLTDRIIYSIEELNDKVDFSCDFTYAHEVLEKERKFSLEYLKNSLEE